MEKIVVTGGNRLNGMVKVSGAKNAVLPIIAASVIGQDKISMLEGIPDLNDVKTISKVLECLGVKTCYSKDNILKIDSTNITSCEAPYELVSKMRASFLVMGALLARKGHAKISQPGGCAIGSRPIDIHLKGFEALGATINHGHGFIEAVAPNGLVGASMYLDFPSVGATENIMMAASTAKGVTIIENAAQEPEIVDLANYLVVMGAKIRGAGTNIIRIEGVEKLVGTGYIVIPDRIEAGTFMTAVAMTGGDVVIENVIPEHLTPLIAKLREAGATIEEKVDHVRVVSDGKLKAINVKTLPYPGYPTDLQAQIMALTTVAEGQSTITETVFENRFMHVEELSRMGAMIKTDSRSARVTGVEKLFGCNVRATDLRAGAALVLAGMVADGDTIIGDIYHIDRGYDCIVDKLNSIGANIKRVEIED